MAHATQSIRDQSALLRRNEGHGTIGWECPENKIMTAGLIRTWVSLFDSIDRWNRQSGIMAINEEGLVAFPLCLDAQAARQRQPSRVLHSCFHHICVEVILDNFGTFRFWSNFGS